MSLCQNRATPLLPLMYLGVHVITSSSTEDEESTQKSSWIEDRKFRLYKANDQISQANQEYPVICTQNQY